MDLDYYEALDLNALPQSGYKKAVKENEDSPKYGYRVYHGANEEGQPIRISREEYERNQATYRPVVLDIEAFITDDDESDDD